jgi:hypothetical protein
MVSDDPEVMQRRRDEMYARNQKLLEDLDKAGLRDGGPVPGSFEINSYLVTGDRDIEPTEE